jgi:hypothetical protein
MRQAHALINVLKKVLLAPSRFLTMKTLLVVKLEILAIVKVHLRVQTLSGHLQLPNNAPLGQVALGKTLLATAIVLLEPVSPLIRELPAIAQAL